MYRVRTAKLRRVFLITLLAILMIGMSIGATGITAAQSSTTACAITPTTVGGQGFSLSGQGFSLSGQGFSLSGQGFSLSGQGFSLSGQGLDPLVVAAEIRDNPVTPGLWISDRIDYFLGALGFNTRPTALLIIDEFNTPDAHGFLVQRVADETLAAARARIPGLQIQSFAVDISSSGTEYSAEAIAAAIANRVDSLRGTYDHFVLNMSFGLIACEAPAQTIAGVPVPAFDYHAAEDVIKANNQPNPTLGIQPILECVTEVKGTRKSASTYIAYFGYKNENDQVVTISVSDNNKFLPIPKDRGQPVTFEPGRQSFVFSVSFDGSTLDWYIKGPDGQYRNATASKYSPRCAESIPQPTQPVTPIVECVADLGSGHYRARFGYNNPNKLGVKITVGSKNKFYPTPENRGQVVTFAPGLHQNVFEVNFNGSDLKWTLNGITVTANKHAPACPQQSDFGLSQYLTQNLGVPASAIGDYWKALANPVSEDEFHALRVLLRGYLQESANSGGTFSAVGVASSGNLRPWLGAAPLAPASWAEVIAVGATLNDSSTIWSFSQDADVLAPGAGYPVGTNSFVAGTSFAAPIFSTLVGLCSTTPDALGFDGLNPPLLSGGNSSNSIIGTSSLSPLDCATNRAPVITPISDRSDPVGKFVSFNVSASDPNNDPLTFTAVGLPTGILIGSTGTISGTPTTAGTYNVTVQVSDGSALGVAETSFVWTITADTSNVKIDIKPLSPHNRINLKSWGKVPVAIFGSSSFDVNTIDPRTITLAGAPVITKPNGQPFTLVVDLNFDRRKDLVVWVYVRDLQLTPESTVGILIGQTYAGTTFTGTDKVNIVPVRGPSLTSPNSSGVVNKAVAKLVWSFADQEEEANTCYLVQVDNNSNFSSPEQSSIVVQAESYNTAPLTNGLYYWRVGVTDCSTTLITPWSDSRMFSVRIR